MEARTPNRLMEPIPDDYPCPLKYLFVHPPPRPPCDGHITPRLDFSDYLANEGWQWKEDIQAWANRHHVLSSMGFKRQTKFSFSSSTAFTSCNHTYFFPLYIEQNQRNPPQQDSPVPSLPPQQTLWQLTPGPSGTQWSEDLFRGKQPKFHLISTYNSGELTLPPFVEPSQTNEPLISALSHFLHYSITKVHVMSHQKFLVHFKSHVCVYLFPM
ncbi:hypothetical protein O181_088099 [Austropuccinia psidii MF-1]|uniref:Uncharacterized protein n=1 Tax=Austropuccinia psidii MF-1 TaxID=1389203 RepID=A0A9Q3IQZ0_9BASI|nr:hypothetical protein [Austropuccinia psidii MF-1]